MHIAAFSAFASCFLGCHIDEYVSAVGFAVLQFVGVVSGCSGFIFYRLHRSIPAFTWKLAGALIWNTCHADH